MINVSNVDDTNSDEITITQGMLIAGNLFHAVFLIKKIVLSSYVIDCQSPVVSML
jgi:hypothetical protein